MALGVCRGPFSFCKQSYYVARAGALLTALPDR
jgi:hypothetical protein